MEYATLKKKIKALPDDLQSEVIDFIDFLILKKESKKPILEEKREFGCVKGQIHIDDDFDEPLEDFKEYM